MTGGAVKGVVGEVEVLVGEARPLRVDHREEEREGRQHDVVERHDAERAPHVEAEDARARPPVVRRERGERREQQRADQEPAQHEEEIHAEPHVGRAQEERIAVAEEPRQHEGQRHVHLEHGDDRERAQAVQRWEAVREQVQAEGGALLRHRARYETHTPWKPGGIA